MATAIQSGFRYIDLKVDLPYNSPQRGHSSGEAKIVATPVPFIGAKPHHPEQNDQCLSTECVPCVRCKRVSDSWYSWWLHLRNAEKHGVAGRGNPWL